MWVVSWSTILARLQGETSLAKLELNRKMHWERKSEKPPWLLTKTENQTVNWRKPANRARHQNQKTVVLTECTKTEKPNQKLSISKNINAPLLRWPGVPSLFHNLSKSGSNIAASTSGWHWKELNDKLILSRWLVIFKICDGFHDLFISSWLGNIETLVSFLANCRLLRELHP